MKIGGEQNNIYSIGLCCISAIILIDEKNARAVLLGGARNQDFKGEETTSLETTEFLQNHLEQFLREIILPNQDFNITHRWSGIMAMVNEKSPLVEKISERQILAVRLSGMGVALAPKIGEIVARKI